MSPPSERGWHMIIIVTVLVALATIAALLRLIARIKLRLKLEMDDYLCFGSLFLLYGMYIELVLWCTIGGNGTHIAELSREELLNFGKIFISNQFTYFFLSPMIKISIIYFYKRIFPTRRFQRITTVINWVIGLWGVGIVFTCALQCRPLALFWDKSLEGKCINSYTFFIVNQVFNVIADFVILGLPLPIVWALKRSWQERLALSSIFAIGGFVCFASIYRIVVLFYIEEDDPTYTVYQATLWTHIEPAVGMICSCLPTIRGLFPKHTFGSKRSGGKSSTQDGYARGTITQNGQPQHFSLTTSNPKNSIYIKMNDIKGFNGEDNSEENLVRPEKPTQGQITVRTEIKVDHA